MRFYFFKTQMREDYDNYQEIIRRENEELYALPVPVSWRTRIKQVSIVVVVCFGVVIISYFFLFSVSFGIFENLFFKFYLFFSFCFLRLS